MQRTALRHRRVQATAFSSHIFSEKINLYARKHESKRFVAWIAERVNANTPHLPNTNQFDHISFNTWHHIPDMAEGQHSKGETPAESDWYAANECAESITPEFGAFVTFIGVHPHTRVAVDTFGLSEYLLPWYLQFKT